MLWNYNGCMGEQPGKNHFQTPRIPGVRGGDPGDHIWAAVQGRPPTLLPMSGNNRLPPCLFTFNLEAQTSLSFITRWPLPSAACDYEVFVPVNLAAMCDSDWQQRGALVSGGRCKLQGSSVGSHLILLGKVSFPFLPIRSLQSVHMGLFGKEETCSDFSLLPSPELHENRCTWAVSEGRGTVSQGFSL